MKEKTTAEDVDFVEDPRYRQCNKEALMGLGLGLQPPVVVCLGLWCRFTVGANYSYILGFPLWFL